VLSRQPARPSDYRVLPDGRFTIQAAQLRLIQGGDASRILDTNLHGRSARILLLDRPFQLGSKVDGADEFYLDRVRLRELPGWPPKLAAPPGDSHPSLWECRLIAARFKRANATEPEGVEFELAHQGVVYRGLLVGAPLALLSCALKTLNEPGVFGNRMIDVQEMRLVGEGKTA
jgi:hypothetical protein